MTILTLTLMSALAAAVVLTTSSETLIAANFRSAQQALYAADGAAEWALADLSAPAADWDGAVSGARHSAFADGPPAGVRVLPAGGTVDLTAVVLNSPGWQLYAYGPLRNLTAVDDSLSQFYIVVLVAPGASPDSLKVRAFAHGPRGARRVLETSLVRGAGGVRVESWTQLS